MTEPLKIGIIVGSVREGRISLPIANWVKQQIDARAEFDADLLDLADWQLPMFAEPNPPATGKYTGEKQRAWAATIGPMDGFILVAPEYNHGMSAVLKNALDTVCGGVGEEAGRVRRAWRDGRRAVGRAIPRSDRGAGDGAAEQRGSPARCAQIARGRSLQRGRRPRTGGWRSCSTNSIGGAGRSVRRETRNSCHYG